MGQHDPKLTTSFDHPKPLGDTILLVRQYEAPKPSGIVGVEAKKDETNKNGFERAYFVPGIVIDCGHNVKEVVPGQIVGYYPGNANEDIEVNGNSYSTISPSNIAFTLGYIPIEKREEAIQKAFDTINAIKESKKLPPPQKLGGASKIIQN